MPKDCTIIDKDTDLIFDQENGDYYLIQYKHEPPYDTRISNSNPQRSRLLSLYNNGIISWKEWS